MKPKIAFEDGSFVEWEDRESVRYTEDGREALIWVDWEPAGWFSSVRIVKADSVAFWGTTRESMKIEIDETKKQEIIGKVVKYFERIGKKVRVDYKYKR